MKLTSMDRRPRRNRKNEVIRSMVRETSLGVEHLIMPLFVIEGVNKSVAINSMPGQFRLSLDLLIKKVEELLKLGVQTIALFPALDESLKDRTATESWNQQGLYLRSIRELKQHFPTLQIMSDVAMDPYSSDGHDGLVDSDSGEILNDETLEFLGKMALAQAEAGVDILGPSDMMDGRVGYLRKVLDENGHTNVSIMSYTAKYASSFYGPFRDALDSSPKKGDKKTYQMDPANSREALIEAELDELEGADFLMVKPGLPYLDIIARLSDSSSLPIAAYNVSGEYAMLVAAAENGWLDRKSAVMEMLLSFRRAGANVILTYFSQEAAEYLAQK